MSIKPLADRVLIEPTAAETKTASGLYIPETAQVKPPTGVVIATGDSDNLSLKVGDIVYFEEYSGKSIEYNGKEYIIMKEEDVLAKEV